MNQAMSITLSSLSSVSVLPEWNAAYYIAARSDCVDRITELPDSTLTTESVHSTQIVAQHRPLENRAKCPDCGVETLPRTLRRHRVKHQEHLRPSCVICGESFEREDILKRHIRESHGAGSKTIVCGNCGSRIHRRALKEHVRSRKCRRLSTATSEQPWSRSTGHQARPVHVPSKLGVLSMLDPVLHAASLHRSVFLALWNSIHSSTEPYWWTGIRLKPDQPSIYRNWYSRMWNFKSGPPEIPSLPSSTLSRYWEPRGLLLLQGQRTIERCNTSEPCELSPSDDDLIHVSLLAAIDVFIFGRWSTEVTCQTKGMARFKRLVPPSTNYCSRLEQLLSYTWGNDTDNTSTDVSKLPIALIILRGLTDIANIAEWTHERLKPSPDEVKPRSWRITISGSGHSSISMVQPRRLKRRPGL